MFKLSECNRFAVYFHYQTLHNITVTCDKTAYIASIIFTAFANIFPFGIVT